MIAALILRRQAPAPRASGSPAPLHAVGATTRVGCITGFAGLLRCKLLKLELYSPDDELEL